VDKKEVLEIVSHGRKPKHTYQNMIMEFMQSGKDASRISLFEDEKVSTIQANIKTTIRRCNLPVSVLRRNSELFLILNQGGPP